jgi:hypothetical protein
MGSTPVQERFTKAVDALIEQVKQDRSILAAILCGSLSHDKVWDKSDVDLVFITIDDRKIETGGRALYADGLNVHALLMPRAEFRKTVEGTLRNSFFHTFLAKGKLLYTHDETIAALCERLGELGERDTQIQLLRWATAALAPLYKAHKWFLTRGDLEYTALFILHTATPLAKMEVIRARMLADREVIPQALQLNPVLFKTIYTNLLNEKKTPKAVSAALEAIDNYLSQRATTLFAPLLEHLRETAEARSATEIEDHFARNYGIDGVTAACEYLADQGLAGKASTAVQLTKRSSASVEELAFFHLEERGRQEKRGRNGR